MKEPFNMKRRQLLRVASLCEFSIALATILLIVFPSLVSAKVTGVCSNCHTMHNSQDGSPIDAEGPNEQLLTSGCVGCHSSTTSNTIIPLGSSDVPIVYNTVDPTTSPPLAGGNFYWVAQGDDTKGHNVYGIAGTDGNLGTAPGRTPGSCVNSCHTSLADPPGSGNSDRGGCRGCHVFTAHHDDSKPWYRFLKGHTSSPTLPILSSASTGTDYVVGVEDNDWEQETAVEHNWYKGTTLNYTWGAGLEDHQTITAFCSGCHGVFHGTRPEVDWGMNNVTGGPWIRHPTDIALPQGDGSEYAAYDPVNNYSVEAPVAWVDPATQTTPVVMCLSCHRAHGSDQPDMLRWDYNTMVVGTTGAAAGTGCFVCHTTKDGI
ncbi:MAG TPA: hypothetical protein ENH38_07425 [Nitrospirae bacterium]|nr:doubled CXXCH motif [bacterium BMS3Abin09]HDZ88431.1 hypothetical protein [Nitrospirota bacterium]